MTAHPYVFFHGDVPLAARIHRETDDWARRQPAVIVTGSWLTVKEQMADHYAQALAAGAPVASFASVAGWFHDTESVAPFYGGMDGVALRLDRAHRGGVGRRQPDRLLRPARPGLAGPGRGRRALP
jgi:hypothetical protein